MSKGIRCVGLAGIISLLGLVGPPGLAGADEVEELLLFHLQNLAETAEPDEYGSPTPTPGREGEMIVVGDPPPLPLSDGEYLEDENPMIQWLANAGDQCKASWVPPSKGHHKPETSTEIREWAEILVHYHNGAACKNNPIVRLDALARVTDYGLNRSGPPLSGLSFPKPKEDTDTVTQPGVDAHPDAVQQVPLFSEQYRYHAYNSEIEWTFDITTIEQQGQRQCLRLNYWALWPEQPPPEPVESPC